MEILYRESHIKQPCYTSEPTGPRERVLLDEHDLGRAAPGQRHAVPWSSSRSSWISLAGSAGTKKLDQLEPPRFRIQPHGWPVVRIDSESWCTPGVAAAFTLAFLISKFPQPGGGVGRLEGTTRHTNAHNTHTHTPHNTPTQTN